MWGGGGNSDCFTGLKKPILKILGQEKPRLHPKGVIPFFPSQLPRLLDWVFLEDLGSGPLVLRQGGCGKPEAGGGKVQLDTIGQQL